MDGEFFAPSVPLMV